MDEIESRRATNLWRAVFVVMALLFFLPLMTIQGCGKEDVPHTYTGLELVFKQHAVGTLICLAAPLFMLAITWLVRDSTLLETGWVRASRAALAMLGGAFFLATTFVLGIFSKLNLEPAGMLLATSFVGVSAVSLLGAWFSVREVRWIPRSFENLRLQRWYRRGLPALWVGVVPLGGLLYNMFDRDGFQFAGVMLALGIPLALSEWFIGVGLSRREPWVIRAIALEAVVEALVTVSVAGICVNAVRGLLAYQMLLLPLVMLLAVPFIALAVWVWWKRRELVDPV